MWRSMTIEGDMEQEDCKLALSDGHTQSNANTPFLHVDFL